LELGPGKNGVLTENERTANHFTEGNNGNEEPLVRSAALLNAAMREKHTPKAVPSKTGAVAAAIKQRPLEDHTIPRLNGRGYVIFGKALQA